MPPSLRIRASVLVAVTAVAVLTVGCDSKSSPQTGAKPDGADVPEQTGGSPGSGGVSTGGSRGSGGTSGEGGIVGSGGMAGSGAGGTTSVDAIAARVCGQDGGRGLPDAARRCDRDEECTVQIARNCCGADEAFGVAVSLVDDYLGCFVRIGLCGMVCGGGPKDYRYVTDTGRFTPAGSAGEMPIGSVAVRCLDQVCTTDVVDAVDGGLDGAANIPAVDATADAPEPDVTIDAGQPCGDAACGAGQACVLITGGPVPPCEPPNDAGICPSGLVQVSSCTGYGAAVDRRPGCSMQQPRPTCYTLPDACSDVCSCVCGGGGLGCHWTGAYFTCTMP